MAISHSVYIVAGIVSCAPGGEEILAGFTVKYEMERWLEKNGRTSADTLLFTMRDGGHGEPREMEWPL